MDKIKCVNCDATGIDPRTNDICTECHGFKELDWITNITGLEITRKHKVMFHVIKTLNELADMGMLAGKALKMTPEAEKLIEGFEPTEEEITEAMMVLKANGFLG